MLTKMAKRKVFICFILCSFNYATSKSIDRKALASNLSCVIAVASCDSAITNDSSTITYKGCFRESKDKTYLAGETSFNMSSRTFSPVSCYLLCNDKPFFGLQYIDAIQKCFCIKTDTKKYMSPAETHSCKPSVIGNDYSPYKYVYVYEHKNGFINKKLEQCPTDGQIPNVNMSCKGKGKKDEISWSTASFTCESQQSSTLPFRCTHVDDESLAFLRHGQRKTTAPASKSKQTASVETTNVMSTTSVILTHHYDSTSASSTRDSMTSWSYSSTAGTADVTMSPWSESTNLFLTTNTTELDLNTTHNATECMGEKYRFDIRFIIGFALFFCSLVVLVAVLSACVVRQRRKGKYSFPIFKAEENQTGTDSNDVSQSITPMISDNYSDPKDTLVPPCNGDKSPQNVYSQSTSDNDGEYNHLNFTIQSDNTQRFASDGEYARPRTNTVSVFDQPWDTGGTSKINKLFSQFRTSVYDSAKNVRNSILKREVRQGSQPQPKNTTNYCNDWQPKFWKEEHSLHNPSKKQTNECSIEMDVLDANDELDSEQERSGRNKHEGLFPALPYSERPNVTCENIYSEPKNGRLSLRQRLSMVTSKPIKMPFGFELNLARNSRKESEAMYTV